MDIFKMILKWSRDILDKVLAVYLKNKYEKKEKRFENKSKVYRGTWKILLDFRHVTCLLFSGEPVDVDEEVLKRYRLEKFSKFEETYKLFSKYIEENRILYKENIYKYLCDVKKICYEIGDMYKFYEIGSRYSKWVSVSFVGLPIKYSKDIYMDKPKKLTN